MIVITRNELVSLDFSELGLAWFDEHVPSGRIEFADRTAFLVWASLHDGADWASRLLTFGDKSHSGADLRGAFLEDALLSDVNLSCADLSGAKLYGARLARADLTNANLSGARLARADLTDTNLSCARLTGADLEGADFSGARLTGADLDGATRALKDPPIPGWVTYSVHRLKRAT